MADIVNFVAGYDYDKKNLYSAVKNLRVQATEALFQLNFRQRVGICVVE